MELTHAIRRAFNLNADTATHDEIRTRILSGGQVTGTNMCVLICAILIASVGLNTGSTAVIIGAMLISPLMGSILAMAYGTAAADYPRFRRHLYGFMIQLIISLCWYPRCTSCSPRSTHRAPSSLPNAAVLLRCHHRHGGRHCGHHRFDAHGEGEQHHSGRGDCNGAHAAGLYLRLCDGASAVGYAGGCGVSVSGEYLLYHALRWPGAGSAARSRESAA